ncbi:MAG: hypothetical protein RSD22_01735 [Romboutsia sp.]
MGTKKKFKRDYIILEAKDTNFRYKERVLPKAFAKVEVNDEKSVIALYIENLKYMKDGYRVVAIQSDYETVDLGKVTLSEQGKGEFTLDLENSDADIKAIAILYEKTVPLIGFKGSKIENYEEILFTSDEEEYVEVDDDEYEYEEIEYIEVEDDEEEGYEYIEVEGDEGYEDIEYIEIEEESDDSEYKEIDNYGEYEQFVPNKRNNEPRQQEYEDITTFKNITNNQIKKDKIKQKQQVNRQNKPQYAQQQTSYQQYQPYQQYQSKQNEDNPRSAGAFLMPRQIKKGLKHFKEVKPFVCDYVEDTRWWKIEINPSTLCGYTMPYLGYVNSLNYTMYSDAIMNSYKYRHYLFGVQYDEYNKRKNYIYAIPGRKDEQPDRGYTGFSVYQACDNRNDSLGYWLCFIDPRSRRIVK